MQEETVGVSEKCEYPVMGVCKMEQVTMQQMMMQ